MPISEVYNEDNMTGMSRYPDKFFELAIVDPEYGIEVNMNMGRRKGMGAKHIKKGWDSKPPSDNYFDELFRISKNQIVWGGNYFNMPPTRGFIVWDKKTPEELSFSMCEFAWTSFDCVAKIFKKPIQTENSNRIHPTQKPVALYKWLLKNYAKQGDKILDTHMGSQSSRIAAYDMGFDFYGWELDKDYFDAGNKRFEIYRSQMKLQFT
jgi:site-specific DNA-methyltransferase (adenine-specific)